MIFENGSSKTAFYAVHLDPSSTENCLNDLFCVCTLYEFIIEYCGLFMLPIIQFIFFCQNPKTRIYTTPKLILFIAPVFESFRVRLPFLEVFRLYLVAHSEHALCPYSLPNSRGSVPLFRKSTA